MVAMVRCSVHWELKNGSFQWNSKVVLNCTQSMKLNSWFSHFKCTGWWAAPSTPATVHQEVRVIWMNGSHWTLKRCEVRNPKMFPPFLQACAPNARRYELFWVGVSSPIEGSCLPLEVLGSEVFKAYASISSSVALPSSTFFANAEAVHDEYLSTAAVTKCYKEHQIAHSQARCSQENSRKMDCFLLEGPSRYLEWSRVESRYTENKTSVKQVST